MKKIYILIIIIPIISSKDYDCASKTQVENEEDCISINTGTNNTCCFVSYTHSNNSEIKQCLLADNSSAVNLLVSINSVKQSLNGTNKYMTCHTKAENCTNITNPTGFESCNVTEQIYPYSCCFVQNKTSSYCYPINASYNSTVQTYIDNNNATLAICTNYTLPIANESFIKIYWWNFILLFCIFI